jgi:hypothetical protein
VERLDRKEQEMKKQKAGGWFSGWFGSSQVKEEENTLSAAAIGQLSQTICVYSTLVFMTLFLLKFQLLFSELLSEPHKSNYRTILKLPFFFFFSFFLNLKNLKSGLFCVGHDKNQKELLEHKQLTL